MENENQLRKWLVGIGLTLGFLIFMFFVSKSCKKESRPLIPEEEKVEVVETQKEVTKSEPVEIKLPESKKGGTFTLEYGSCIWKKVIYYAKEKLSLAEVLTLSKLICWANQIEVPEWNLEGKINHRRIPAGTKIKVPAAGCRKLVCEAMR